VAKVALIVAVSENNVIGLNNSLPWRISADLKHFKRITLGKPVIMGRLTWESIGKPLPGRSNIVMTRDTSWQAKGAECAANLEQALAIARKIARDDEVNEIMIIGGETIYREALPLAQRLYLTRVHVDINGDAFFPELDMNEWEETLIQKLAAEGDVPACTFLQLDRK